MLLTLGQTACSATVLAPWLAGACFSSNTLFAREWLRDDTLTSILPRSRCAERRRCWCGLAAQGGTVGYINAYCVLDLRISCGCDALCRDGTAAGSPQAMSELGHFYGDASRRLQETDPLHLRKPVRTIAMLSMQRT